MKRSEALLIYGACVDEKDKEIAIAQLLILVAQYPLYWAYCRLAILYQQTARPRDALKWHKKALRVKLNDLDTWHHLADCYSMLGLFETAELCYLAYLERRPKEPHICEDLAQIYYNRRDYFAAIAYAKIGMTANKGTTAKSISILSASYLHTHDYKALSKLRMSQRTKKYLSCLLTPRI